MTGPGEAGAGMPVLDLRGLNCPLPVLRTKKALAALAPGATLSVQTTDALAVIDIPAFCNEAGHTLVKQSAGESFHTFVIRRG